MTERQSEDSKATSSRRRVGKIALVLGVCLVASLIVLGAFVSLAAAYTGDSALNQLYLDIAIPGLLLGFLLMIIGATSVLLSEGFSKDWIWSMQVGPYVR